jgi:hypothetical protein
MWWVGRWPHRQRALSGGAELSTETRVRIVPSRDPMRQKDLPEGNSAWDQSSDFTM